MIGRLGGVIHHSISFSENRPKWGSATAHQWQSIEHGSVLTAVLGVPGVYAPTKQFPLDGSVTPPGVLPSCLRALRFRLRDFPTRSRCFAPAMCLTSVVHYEYLVLSHFPACHAFWIG